MKKYKKTVLTKGSLPERQALQVAGGSAGLSQGIFLRLLRQQRLGNRPDADTPVLAHHCRRASLNL